MTSFVPTATFVGLHVGMAAGLKLNKQDWRNRQTRWLQVPLVVGSTPTSCTVIEVLSAARWNVTPVGRVRVPPITLWPY